MDAPINTVVAGTANTCRSTADWLNKVGGGVTDIGTGLYQARTNSESCWSGGAGDAFRNVMNTNGRDADELAEQVNVVRLALIAFADALETITKRMEETRQMARSKKLVVTPTTIEPPQMFPRDAQLTPQQASDQKDKIEGFQEAKETVRNLRSDEKTAHEKLASSMKIHKTFLEMLTPSSWMAQGNLILGAYSGSHIASVAFAEKASEQAALANASRALLNDPNLAQAERQLALSSFLQAEAAGRSATRAASSAAVVDDLIPGAGWTKDVAGYSYRGVGAAGATVSAFAAYQAIKHGQDPGRVVTVTGAQVASGAAVGAAFSWAAGAGLITGTVATGGTLLVGTAVSAGVGYVVDYYYDDIKDGIYDAGKYYREHPPKMSR